MVSVDITIMLPDELARKAEAAGLLTAEALQRIIAEKVADRPDQIEQHFVLLERLPDSDKGALTEADVAAEIRAYRAEKRAAREGRH